MRSGMRIGWVAVLGLMVAGSVWAAPALVINTGTPENRTPITMSELNGSLEIGTGGSNGHAIIVNQTVIVTNLAAPGDNFNIGTQATEQTNAYGSLLITTGGVFQTARGGAGYNNMARGGTQARSAITVEGSAESPGVWACGDVAVGMESKYGTSVLTIAENGIVSNNNMYLPYGNSTEVKGTLVMNGGTLHMTTNNMPRGTGDWGLFASTLSVGSFYTGARGYVYHNSGTVRLDDAARLLIGASAGSANCFGQYTISGGQLLAGQVRSAYHPSIKQSWIVGGPGVSIYHTFASTGVFHVVGSAAAITNGTMLDLGLNGTLRFTIQDASGISTIYCGNRYNGTVDDWNMALQGTIDMEMTPEAEAIYRSYPVNDSRRTLTLINARLYFVTNGAQGTLRQAADDAGKWTLFTSAPGVQLKAKYLVLPPTGTMIMVK